MDALFAILPLVAVVVVFFAFVGLVLARLYKRATREVSLVRTGSGGQRVIMDGGALVVPLLHEIAPVNMKTLRLEVKREGDASLITKDRMRVDVGAEFYVRVEPTEEGVARSAQTLGDKTFKVEALREMIEGKLIDGLRAVAAQMTMDDLHENRSGFVQQVQQAVGEDLTKNGLELESVSLTSLDQTPFAKLDENNAFNAVGMRQLAEVIAHSKKRRAEIEAEADVAVRRAALEAEKKKIDIAREEEQARIAQQQEIETLKAAQQTEIAQRRSAAEQTSEAARIAKERAVRAADIEREQSIRAAEIAKEQAIAVAEQERQIAVARKSEEESQARAKADLARADAAKAEETIRTARETAQAERERDIALIEARRQAQVAATRITVEAEAEKAAAADRAAARLEEARADAEAISIRAQAKKVDMLAEAEGRRAITEAENALSDEIVAMKIAMKKIDMAPALAAELVKPAEKIDSIRIHHVGGLGGGVANGAAGGNGAAGAATPVGEAMNAMLGMAVQMPALRQLGRQIGLSFEDALPEDEDGAADGAAKPDAPKPPRVAQG